MSLKQIVVLIMTISRDLLKILMCPVSGGILEYDRENQELISKKSGLAFPIKDGIPVMLQDEARRIK